MEDDKYIVHGPPALDVPHMSLGQYVLQRIITHGDEVAMIDSLTGQTVTFYEVYRKTVLLAQNLRALGLRKGDVVGICSENNLHFPLAALAVSYIGVTCAPYNCLYTPGEMLHTMSIARPRIVFASAFTIQRVLEVSKDIDSIRDIILIGDSPPPKDVIGVLRLSDLLNPLSEPISRFEPTKVDPQNDTAAILCSSGTTGLPKGVELSHLNLLHFIHVITECSKFTKGDTLPGIVPFFHAYGFGLLYMSMSLGVKMVCAARFEERTFLKMIQDYKITQMFVVPPVMVFLGKSPIVDKFDLSSVKSITCGAAPLSRAAQEDVEKKLKNAEIRQGYGMTECSIVATTFYVPDLNKTGSSGQLVHGFKAKLLDIEDNSKIIPPNKPGVVCLKGPMIMKGYRNNVQETKSTITEDGWLITGDIGYFDEDGCLFVVDRVKELIKYKGYQVPPAELEAILYTHPGIRDAGVVGLPNDVAGELPIAFVVRQPDSKITEKDVLEYVAARVSPQKHLRGGVRFVSEIPRNPSGKILRRVLRSKL